MTKNMICSCLLPVFLVAGPGFTEKKPFKVICYSGYRDGQGPGGLGEPSEAQVTVDLEMIKAYTHGIRSYSCGKGSHEEKLPGLCDKLGLSLYMGVWISNANNADNQIQVDNAIRLVNENHPSIKAVIVGNEYLLRSDVEEHIPRAISEAKLLGYIKQVQNAVPENIIVTTAEPYWWWDFHSDALWNGVDAIYWHAHPYWDNFSIDNAVNLINTQHTKALDRLKKLGTPNKPDVCTETGWPTGTTRGPSVGSETNQARFVQELHNYAWPKAFEYWIFSAFDENWKSNEGAVGSQWGLWRSNRTPKQAINQISQIIPKNKQYDETQGGVATIGHSLSVIQGKTDGSFGIFNLLGQKVSIRKKQTGSQSGRILISGSEKALKPAF